MPEQVGGWPEYQPALAKAVAYPCESGVSASIVQLGTGSASSPDRAYDFVSYLYDYATSKKQQVRQL
jgi:hypothetical protein